MKNLIGFAPNVFFVCMILLLGKANAESEKMVIYGDHHIFTIDRLDNWVLDKNLAASQQLASFFYPADSKNKSETYFYAQGWDKPSKDSTLQEFVESDISQIKQSFPNVTYKKMKQEASGLTPNAWLYTYMNMGNRFKDEVYYLESDTAVITLVFSTKSEDGYKKYANDFNKMVSSFEYLSSGPEIIKQSLKSLKGTANFLIPAPH